MNPRPTTLVIGAGLGGIAAAARLARHGYQVTVVEKNSRPGGRCDQLVRDGHRFDVGPTLFLMPEVFAETYAALGERMADHLDLRRVDPTYRIRFDDGQQLALTSDLNALETQLEAIEPGSFGGLLRYLDEGRRHYHVSLARFVGRNFDSYLDYFSPQNLPLLFQLKALVKHYDNIGRYFRGPRLKAAFTFQNMYLGLSPYDAPATYSLLQYTELAGGVWFPTGGLYRVIESLAAIAQNQGVTFHYNAPVSRIEVDGSRATGVVLADGTRLGAEVVIANADLPYVYRDLLPDPAAAAALEHKKYTCSALMFYWGFEVRGELHGARLAQPLQPGQRLGLQPEPRLLAGGLPTAAQPPRPLSQPVFRRRQHAPRHRPADGADLGPADRRARLGRRRIAPTSPDRMGDWGHDGSLCWPAARTGCSARRLSLGADAALEHKEKQDDWSHDPKQCTA
jgi:phytoene desaturase